LSAIYIVGGFDSSVHISEEASNAATATPWAIVWSISIAGVLGLGSYFTNFTISALVTHHVIRPCDTAVNVTLAFCMGKDLEGLMGSGFGQPLAQIFFNSFGRRGTLAIWSFIIVTQYMMGSTTVRPLSSSTGTVQQLLIIL
jgi:hypothetical protein